MSINKFKNMWISNDATTNDGYSLVNEGKSKFNNDVTATKYLVGMSLFHWIYILYSS